MGRMIAGHFTSGALRTSIFLGGWVTIDENRYKDERGMVLADICKQWAVDI